MTTATQEYTDVYLAGELGKKFGRKWRLVCRNPAQAMRLIGLNCPAFKKHMIERAQAGDNYHIICDKRSRTAQELELPAGKRLIIATAVTGAKGGIGSALEIVAGIILLVVAWWNPGGWTGAGALFLDAVGAVGASLVLAGMTSLLSPQASAGGQLTSAYFNGAGTTVQQGAPVPVVYGEMLIGAQVISLSLQTVDAASAPAEQGLNGAAPPLYFV